MSATYHSYLVNQAFSRRDAQLGQALKKSLSLESFQDSDSDLETLARDLKLVNDHIKIDDKILDEASSDYDEISQKLVDILHWPNEAIRIIPQGSVSTKTLIRSPDSSKFDIDAVCAVDLSMTEVSDPMDFYEKVGLALESWEPEPKKRCWKIDFNGRRYYIEFTPSTPLDKVSPSPGNFIKFSTSNRYRDTALAIVDTPSKQWKTSNPEGLSNWFSEQAARPLLRWLVEKFNRDSYKAESVTPVPDQEVDLSDTLRVAVRLLKRHRDMSVRRNYVESELRPISIVIVTLLTQCYEGLADKGDIYTHPIELLIDLVELMPHMIEVREGEYWIANPTVEGENFAEKWNQNPKLKSSFDEWTSLLIEDLKRILATTDESARHQKIKEVFGCWPDSSTPPGGHGLAPTKPAKPHVAPPTDGLA